VTHVNIRNQSSRELHFALRLFDKVTHLDQAKQ
jgi:hypothetical protein